MDRLIELISINLMAIVLFMVTYFLNKLSNKGIFFGVRFPMEYLKEKELLDLDKSYKRIVLALFSVVLVVVNMVGFNISNFTEDIMGMSMGVITIVLLVGANLLFILYYFRTKKLKRERGWTYKRRNVVVTDTTLRKPKKDEKYKSIPSKWFLLLLVFPIAMAILTAYKYNSLPQIMDIPNTTFGTFEPYTLRGKLIIYQLPLSQLVTGVLMYIISIVISNSKSDLNSGAIQATVIRKKKYKRLGSLMLMATTLQIMILFSILQGAILFQYGITIINYMFMIIILLTVLIFIVAFIRVGQGGKNPQSIEEKDELYKDDDDKWILGGLYYNKNDPAWMVEKRIGIGWTVNFANPKSWIAIGVLILFIVINIVISLVISK